MTQQGIRHIAQHRLTVAAGAVELAKTVTVTHL
jgi:hypothetical protein